MTLYHQTKSGKVLRFTFDLQTQTGTLNTLEFQCRGNFLEFFHNGTEIFPPDSIYQAVHRFRRLADNQTLGVAA